MPAQVANTLAKYITAAVPLFPRKNLSSEELTSLLEQDRFFMVGTRDKLIRLLTVPLPAETAKEAIALEGLIADAIKLIDHVEQEIFEASL